MSSSITACLPRQVRDQVEWPAMVQLKSSAIAVTKGLPLPFASSAKIDRISCLLRWVVLSTVVFRASCSLWRM